jgi:hypothetical protein
VVINERESFIKSNDITHPTFNPVISKIATFMEKKEKKNADPNKNC